MSYITKERREAYVEVLQILDNMDIYYKEKIPLNVREHLRANASKEYVFNLDLLKPLEQQNLKNITKNVLATFNLNYWCESEQEKEKWEKIYTRNRKKHDEELNEKYNIDNVFEKRRKNSLEKVKNNITEEAPKLDIVEYEETLLEKVINKIKSFFNIRY